MTRTSAFWGGLWLGKWVGKGVEKMALGIVVAIVGSGLKVPDPAPA